MTSRNKISRKARTQSKNSYDYFAPCYDLAMGDRKEVALTLKKMIHTYHPTARNLLELGCGSGSLMKVLSKTYRCHGIDLSPGMVAVAEKKAPRAQFSVGDIAQLDLKQQFDVILCAFDTMNHITSYSAWQKVFEQAHKHLCPTGIFIFDINTEKKLSRYSIEPPFACFHKKATATFEVTQNSKSRFTINIKVFNQKLKNLYEMRELSVKEATFPVPRILKTLSKHFQTIELLDLDNPAPSMTSEELYFVCKNPRA